MNSELAPNFPGPAETRAYLRKYAQTYLALDCGAYTYGRPLIHVADSDKPRALKIGRYCSIGDNVQIFVGRQGRHYYDTITTFPILMASSQKATNTLCNEEISRCDQGSLDVNIGHDVWIGNDATIMAGVTIGTGAVIGTKALVTKNVPPYAIVGGVPASIIKFRHAAGIINALLATQWYYKQPDELVAILGNLILSTNINECIRRLNDRNDK
jgi:acetyltransferase-like isoleucine patch superfamily enzyme